MNILAGHEDEPIVGIPPVVRIGIVRVEPRAVGTPPDIEHVRVAIRVGCVQSAAYYTTHQTLTEILMVYFWIEFYSAS